jgi:hypothetical protein
MDLASREIASMCVPITELSGELEVEDGLPSPLAEIAAQATVGRHEQAAKPNKSRSRRPRPSLRRKSRRTDRRVAPCEVVVGILAGINDDGQPLVRQPLDPVGRVSLARSTVPITSDQIDREVVLAFECGDPWRPIVLGVLCPTGNKEGNEQGAVALTVNRPIVQATLDGEQLVFSAGSEIVLQCGKASLTLTRAGKVLIRGTYLLSRSSGANRIKGGSVQIN